MSVRGGDEPGLGSRLEKERAFHDSWAAGVLPREVAVKAAFEHLTAPENRFILSLAGDIQGLRVLDLGSGLGESAIYFALRGAKVTATDISPEMCELCRRGAREQGVELEAIATAVEELRVPEGSFDIVYGANLLHHVSDIDATLGSVHRALRPGGRCFFWDPLAYNPVINVYRRMATRVRTDDERPLRFEVLDIFRRHFERVGHREFWLTTLSIFLKYYLLDGIHPNASRYWKRILEEDERRLRWWFDPLQRLDDLILRLPLVRRLAWNMVVFGARPK
jgi:2-polyprenyl-3-methyl-5-hydroxy-6-metoxy-1,4-benzoquinol methylase